MSDESTPLTSTEDTSNESMENTSVTTELEVETNEPEIETVEADNQDNQKETEPAKEPEKLYGNKYKTVEELEKGYKEAEKAFTRNSELEKQLEVYRKQEKDAKLKRETEARQSGYTSVEQQEVDFAIKDHEFKLYVDAFNMTPLSPEHRAEAQALLNAYSESKGMRKDYLEQAMGYFSAGTVSKIAQDVALFRNRKEQEYFSKQGEELKQKYSNIIEQTKVEYPMFHEDDSIKSLFADALGLTKGNLDLARFNKQVSDLEAYFIKKYEAKQTTKDENDNLKQGLSAPDGFNSSSTDSKWITKEQYDSMTPEQADKAYDLINEQVLLEKAGKLPRMLT